MRCRRCSTPTWRARPAGGCCCASRTSTRRAAGRNTRRRSTRTSPGSASPGSSRCGGSPSITPITAPRSPSSRRMGLIYPSFESRAEIARMVAEREARALAARSRRRAALSRRRASRWRRPSAPRRIAPASLTRCASTWPRRSRAPVRSPGHETGAGPAGETGAIAADPAAWGDVILARKETPTSYHLAVVVDDAAQGVTDVVRGRDLFHVDQRAPPAAGAARPARAALSPSPPDPRRRRQQAVEIDAGHGLARAARARRDAGRHPQAASGSIERGFRAIVGVRGGGRMAKRKPRKRPRKARARPRKARRGADGARSKPRSPASRTTSARR